MSLHNPWSRPQPGRDRLYWISIAVRIRTFSAEPKRDPSKRKGLFSIRTIYKPHSVQHKKCLGDHLSGRHVAIPLDAAYPGLAPSRWRVHIWRRAASRRPQTTSSLLGLAPSGGYLATHITARAGGLLHHLFTLAITPSLYPKGEGEARRFVSVALSGRFTPLGGFPARDRPIDLTIFYDNRKTPERQLLIRKARQSGAIVLTFHVFGIFLASRVRKPG